MTKISRRGFLGILGGGTTGLLLGSATLDSERLLWVPGQRTLFLPPERTLVQARTLQEALSKGLTAVFPDGSRMRIVIGPPSPTHDPRWPWAQGGWSRMTLAELVQREVRGVEAMGGRVIKIADLHVPMHDPLGKLQPGWNW